MDVSSFFRGKRITVIGLGLLGRGVGDIRYLAQCGAELIVTDLKSSEELSESVAELKQFPHIQFVFGEHRLEDFRNRDLILKAAGVPMDSTYIEEAKKNSIPVRMSADLFMELSEVPVIGVTGTRGKSTVVHLIYAILQKANIRTVLGGNIRDVSTLALLPEITKEHIAVLELDSWQCQGLGEISISPHTAVFTTFFQDHIDYYKDDPGAYLSDKSNIFLYQDPDDTLVIGGQCAPTLIEAYGENIISNITIADESSLPEDWKLLIPGRHNRYNAALALAVARSLDIDDAVSRSAIEDFSGVSGRLEFLTETKGVRIYNDTTATTPEATLVAIAALGVSHTVLIMGGADKGLNMSALLAVLPSVKHVVLLDGTGTERIKDSLPKGTTIYGSIDDAFEAAQSAAEEGDTILFSPAFASFGMFKNEYDRGDQFAALVRDYVKC